ncbi:MAG: YkgJ family cysteine cluster protein [Thermoplasmata archaeon]
MTDIRAGGDRDGVASLRALDRSELEGLVLDCPESCAYCCLCPPELLNSELERFLSLRPNAVERRWGSFHLALQGGQGACTLLKDRRCQDYGGRPFHCRAFPIRVHFLYRVQACAILSCRGIRGGGWSLPPAQAGPRRFNGSASPPEAPAGLGHRDERIQRAPVPLTEILDAILSEGQERARTMSASAEAAWSRFSRRARRAGMLTDPRALRAAMSSEIDLWPDGIHAEEEEAREIAIGIFGARDLMELPIYLSPDLSWHVFRIRSGALTRHILHEDGSLSPAGRWRLEDVPLLELDAAGKEELRRYLHLLNRRDSTLAAAAHVTASGGFGEELEEVYYDTLRDCALDLWWRSSLLARINGANTIGGAELREGVVFCDADFLDMSGIGGML